MLSSEYVSEGETNDQNPYCGKTGFDSISKFAIYAVGEGLIVSSFPV